MTTRLPHLLLVALFLITSITYYTQHQGSYRPSATSDNPISTNSNFEKIISPSTFFRTKVFLDRNRTFVSVPIKSLPSYPIYIYLKMQQNPNIEWIMYHPQLQALNWNRISDGPLNLFQRQTSFETISQFLSNPPQENVIYADPLFVNDPRFKHLSLRPITADTNFKDADFILTTYTPPQKEGDVFFFETIIDATDAFVNENGELVWQIKGLEVSDANPFYLGNIHVDYRLK